MAVKNASSKALSMMHSLSPTSAVPGLKVCAYFGNAEVGFLGWALEPHNPSLGRSRCSHPQPKDEEGPG